MDHRKRPQRSTQGHSNLSRDYLLVSGCGDNSSDSDERLSKRRRDPRIGKPRVRLDTRTGTHRPDPRTGTHRPDPRVLRHRDRGNKVVAQEWDIDNPCGYCGCVFLKSESAHFRKKCCCNASVDSNYWPKLLPIPLELRNVLLDNIEHMSQYSAYYNKMLSVVSVGADNNSDNNKLYQQFNGVPHTIRLQGSAYYYLPQDKNFKGRFKAIPVLNLISGVRRSQLLHL